MPDSGTPGGGRIRAIVLDFNGTLAQDDHLVAPLYVDMFASVGVPLAVAEDPPIGGYADVVVERLDHRALDQMLALGFAGMAP